MANSLMHIHAVVAYESTVSAKVMEAVQYLYEATDHSKGAKAEEDGGIAAVFVGVAQGKTFLKLAHAAAQQSQQETVHLQELTSSTQEIEKFTREIPEDRMTADFDKALNLATTLLDHVATASSQQATNAAKTLIGDAKRKVSDLVVAIGKSFFRGDFTKWMTSWLEYHANDKLKYFQDLPTSFRRLDVQKSKHLNKEAFSYLEQAVAAMILRLTSRS